MNQTLFHFRGEGLFFKASSSAQWQNTLGWNGCLISVRPIAAWCVAPMQASEHLSIARPVPAESADLIGPACRHVKKRHQCLAWQEQWAASSKNQILGQSLRALVTQRIEIRRRDDHKPGGAEVRRVILKWRAFFLGQAVVRFLLIHPDELLRAPCGTGSAGVARR